MTDVPNPPDPKRLLAAAGLRPKKSWGQNFLTDASLLAAIAREVGAAPGVSVLELGAGLGALTHHLLAAGARVWAVERDRELVPLLGETLAWAGERLSIIEADAVTFDYGALRRELGSRLRVCGNLPYQLSGRILGSVADAQPDVERAVLMVQKEVGERLVATPGGRDYGLLSVLVGRAFNLRRVRRVPAGAFMPRPKVDSAVVLLSAHDRMLPPAEDAALVTAARAAFSQRRKTLNNALAGGLGVSKAEVQAALAGVGIDGGARAETLNLADFTALGRALGAAGLLVTRPDP